MYFYLRKASPLLAASSVFTNLIRHCTHGPTSKEFIWFLAHKSIIDIWNAVCVPRTFYIWRVEKRNRTHSLSACCSLNLCICPSESDWKKGTYTPILFISMHWYHYFVLKKPINTHLRYSHQFISTVLLQHESCNCCILLNTPLSKPDFIFDVVLTCIVINIYVIVIRRWVF